MRLYLLIGFSRNEETLSRTKLQLVVKEAEEDRKQEQTAAASGVAPGYLVHEVCDGLDEAAVLLCQEPMAPLLLLQSLLVAPLEELQVLALILPTVGDLRYPGPTDRLRDAERRGGTDRAVRSPQLPLQGRRLVVDLHLVELPAVLQGRDLVSGAPASPSV